MRAVLDALITVLCAALTFAKLTNEGWNRFPYDAPVRFYPSDLLGLAMLGLLIVRIIRFPGTPFFNLPRMSALSGAMLREASAKRATLALASLFFGTLLAIHLGRHWSFNTELHDQSLVHQALFWPWDKHPLNSDVMVNGSFLSAHLAFTFFLLAPLTAFVHVDEFIFLLQTLVIAIPTWLAFAFGPLRAMHKHWRLTFIIIAAHAAIRNGLIWDFREDCLAFGFLLTAVVALHQQRLVVFSIAFVLALLSKEYLSFITLFLVFPILFESTLGLEKRARLILATAVALSSLAWSVISLKVLTPYFALQGGANHDMVRYFPGLGAQPSEIVVNLLTSPRMLLSMIFAKLFTREALTYLLFLLMPFGYFLRKGGWWLVPALPGIAMNVLSERQYLRFLSFHYDWVIMPFLIIALMVGVGKLEQQKALEMKHWVLALAVAFAFSGSWPLVRYYQKFLPDVTQLQDVIYLKRIPSEGVLGVAWDQAIPHLSHVREIRMFNDENYWASDNESIWRNFWSLNVTDWTRIPGHGAHESTRLLLDLKSPIESSVAATALNKGWQVVSTSPSSRYLYLEKHQR